MSGTVTIALSSLHHSPVNEEDSVLQQFLLFSFIISLVDFPCDLQEIVKVNARSEAFSKPRDHFQNTTYSRTLQSRPVNTVITCSCMVSNATYC